MVVRSPFAVVTAFVALTLLQVSCGSNSKSNAGDTGNTGGDDGGSSGVNASSSGNSGSSSGNSATSSSGASTSSSSGGTNYVDGGAVVPPPPPNNRVVYSFNHGWKFIETNVTGASAPTFDDSKWTDVSLPHTYNDVDMWVDWVSFATDMPVMRTYRGLTWYRKHFTVPMADMGRKVFLEFQGVRDMGTFYVNGKDLGFCEDEISPCGIDITSAVNIGADNVIAIEVSNDDLEHDQTYAPGFVFDWSTVSFYPMYGGLYTDANLIVTDKLHQTLPLYRNLATQGVYVYANNVDTLAKSATVTFEAEVQNEYPMDETGVTLTAELIDRDGNTVWTQTSAAQTIPAALKPAAMSWPTNTAPGPTGTGLTKLTVSAPLMNAHLWAPDYPYVYTARSYLTVGGNVVDVVDNPLGIRTYTFSAMNGFKINGHQTWFEGYSPREVMDWSGPGTPQDWMTEYDYLLMKQANGFFMRPMHVAPREHMLASADQLGVLFVVPAGAGEGCTGDLANAPQRFAVMQNVTIYLRNHPSVVFFEACNGASNAQEMQTMQTIRDTWDGYGGKPGMRDPSAPIAGTRQTNVVAGQEYGCPEDGTARSTTIPIFDSENSRQEAPRRVWDKYTPAWNPNGTPPGYVTGGYVNIASPYYNAAASCPGGIETTAGNCIAEYPLCDYRLNSSEALSLCNVLKSWNAYAYSSFVEPASVRMAQGVQAGNSKIFFADSDSDGRMKDTEVARVSGIVDGSRLIKEAFYAMQAATSTVPAVAILGHWNYPQGTTKTVYAVVNCGTGAPNPSAVTLGTYFRRTAPRSSRTTRARSTCRAARRITTCGTSRRWRGNPASSRRRPRAAQPR